MYNTATRAVGALTAVLLLAGCGAEDGTAAAEDGPGLHLVAGFYPLQFAAERVAGDTASVVPLTKPGGEPHDLELSPRDVATVDDADLVVYLAGFQPAVDEAVEQEASDTSLDVGAAARLDLTYTPIEDGAGEADAVDPHFWLDPTRLADVADAIAARLSEIAPAHAAAYERNAAALRTQLMGLDSELAAGLADCANRDIVTSHTAFGYLAERYDLRQVGITGLTPDDEPSPQDLAAVTRFVEDNDVTTIYYETLASPAVAETVAGETGAQTAVLDPIEGITDDSAGGDYVEIMRANLASLQGGQSCD